MARIAETRVARGGVHVVPEAVDIATAVATYPVVHTAGGEYDNLVWPCRTPRCATWS